MIVRLADEGDAEAIGAIYNAEVGSTSTFDLEPRSHDEQIAWLAEHSGAYSAIVVEDDGEVTGFGSLSQYRSRPAYATTVEDSVYVALPARGRGAGRLLVEGLVEGALRNGFHAVMARIVGDNEASIRLHRSCGFELVGIEREVGRKLGRWLDVAVMQLLL